MAAPVLFLEPVFIPRDQQEHREKIKNLDAQSFGLYLTKVILLESKGRLDQKWKMDQVLEERRARHAGDRMEPGRHP